MAHSILKILVYLSVQEKLLKQALAYREQQKAKYVCEAVSIDSNTVFLTLFCLSPWCCVPGWKASSV